MIKIRGKDQSWNQTFPLGIEKLTEMFKQRIDIDKVFSHANLVEKLVLKSGGSLRELMRLIQEAYLETMGDRIDEAAAEKAVVNVRAESTRPMPQTYFAELAKIHQGKQTDNTADQRSILFYRYALEYNGDRWVDVHPLIYDMPEFQREFRSLGGVKRTRTKKANK